MIGQSVGSDANPLSCFLFHPRKSCEKHRKCSHTNVSNASVIRFSTPPAQTATLVFTSESGYTLGFAQRIAHSGLHGETRGISDGGAITTLGLFHTFTNIPGPGVRTANFAAFGSWLGVLTKNAESLRDSDALMRVAVPRRRGPAGPRDLFTFVEIAACTPCAQSFPRVQGGERYHYPRRALHVLETLDGRLSKRLVCRFLRSMGIAPRATPIFLRIYRYSCR